MVDVHWLALSLLHKVGKKTLSALMETFGDAESVLQADMKALLQVRGVGLKTAEAIRAVDLNVIRSEIEQWQAKGVSIYPAYATDYPSALQPLDDAPPTLFVRGILNPQAKAVAIVGTRSPSDEARNIAFELGKCLAEQGWTIVSGLAHGIDTAAHEGALSVADGRTVAVLGGGVLNIYPVENESLAQRILEQGALVGENHPDATPNAARLVSRNRIISGLCQHVIVVETGIDGGAMYAARFATTQGRIVHAVGLPVSGNLELLKNNARYINPYSLVFTLD
jgi:DNA processing protein